MVNKRGDLTANDLDDGQTAEDAHEGPPYDGNVSERSRGDPSVAKGVR